MGQMPFFIQDHCVKCIVMDENASKKRKANRLRPAVSPSKKEFTVGQKSAPVFIKNEEELLNLIADLIVNIIMEEDV